MRLGSSFECVTSSLVETAAEIYPQLLVLQDGARRTIDSFRTRLEAPAVAVASRHLHAARRERRN